MIEDFREGSGPFRHEADLCIIGAGPAGITIANAFVGSRHRICLIESGGLTCETESQALAEGSSIGHPGLHPAHSRLRVYGGSCRMWGGGCMPLSPYDFEPRDWIPYSGWPIGSGELEPWYNRARDVCGLQRQALVDGAFRARPRRFRIGGETDAVVDRVFAQSPVEFGRTSLPMFANAPNVHVLLHANLLELHADPAGGHVGEARIGALGGRRGSVRARYYVLAGGGIENARLLLLSDSQVPCGLGNSRGLVGRFFQDHPRCRLGVLMQGRLDSLLRTYGHLTGAEAYPELCLSENAQRTHRMLGCRARPYAVHAPPSPGVQALRDLRAYLVRPRREMEEGTQVEREVAGVLDRDLPTPLPPPDPQAVRPVRAALMAGRHAGDVATGLARRLQGGSHLQREQVEVMGYFEQAPNPDSRVRLCEQRDALGQRRVQVDMRLTTLDHATHRSAAQLFGEDLARACGSRFQPDPWLADPEGRPNMHGTAHHIGTTRMSDSPRDGVVNRDCGVHDVENLYVAGSSVFPTGGWAFPTFTIVALGLRLADHLRSRLEKPASLVA